MKISVIIPAHNEETAITQCLEALAKQTVQEPFQVIVVDNASTDHTREAAEKMKGTLSVRVIDEPVKGRGAARATGFAAATGEILFSTDADTIVPPQWISSFLDYFEQHENVVALTSPPSITDCSPVRNFIFNTFVPTATHWFNLLYFHHPGLYGFSFAIRKNAYDQSGGFSANDDAYEDLMLASRVHQRGKIEWLPHVPVLFSGRRFRKSLLRGWWEYIQSFIQKFMLKQQTVLLADKR